MQTFKIDVVVFYKKSIQLICCDIRSSDFIPYSIDYVQSADAAKSSMSAKESDSSNFYHFDNQHQNVLIPPEWGSHPSRHYGSWNILNSCYSGTWDWDQWFFIWAKASSEVRWLGTIRLDNGCYCYPGWISSFSLGRGPNLITSRFGVVYWRATFMRNHHQLSVSEERYGSAT